LRDVIMATNEEEEVEEETIYVEFSGLVDTKLLREKCATIKFIVSFSILQFPRCHKLLTQLLPGSRQGRAHCPDRACLLQWYVRECDGNQLILPAIARRHEDITAESATK